MFKSIGLLVVLTVPVALGSDNPPRELPPVSVLTRELLDKWDAERKGREESGLPKPQPNAEYKSDFDAYMARLDLLWDERGKSPTLNDAIRLVDHLYEDMGAPNLNGRWQDEVLEQIEMAATRPGIGKDAVEVLCAGLLTYAEQGGGASTPASKTGLAKTLTVVGVPAYPEWEGEVDRLVREAVAYAQELDRPIYNEIVQRDRERIENATRWLDGRKRLAKRKLSEETKAWALDVADRLLRALAIAESPKVDIVERAARFATVDFGEPDVNEDMIARLLIAYRLRLENRKGLKTPVMLAIDKKLLWLVDEKTRKLTSKRHWSLWARAVGAIPRKVVSRDLQGFLRRGEKAKENQNLAKASAEAQRRLRAQ